MPERKSHYLKIAGNLFEWIPGGAVGDWQQQLFDDATYRGTKMVVERLPPNDKGVRAALWGERYYFEVGRDRDRADSMFLMRVERAEHRARRGQPITLARDIHRWRGADGPDRDDVAEVFGAPAVTESSSPTTEADEPTQHLLGLLAAAPAELRSKYRPPPAEPELPEVNAILDTMRRVWVQHRVDQHVSVTDRQERLLKGFIRPKELGSKERKALLRVFGFELLNVVATVNDTEVVPLLANLLDLPLTDEFRGCVWAGMTAGLDSQGMRRELHASADGLRRLATSGSLGDDAAMIPRLLFAGATRNGDERLLELRNGATAPTDAIMALAQWVEGLDFAPEPEPADTVAMPPPDTAEAPSPAADQRVDDSACAPQSAAPSDAPPVVDDPIEAWLLRQRFPDRAIAEHQLDAGRKHLRALASEGMLLLSLADIAWWQRSLLELRTLADSMVNTLSVDVARAEVELSEARGLYGRARRVVGDAALDLFDQDALLSPSELEQVVTILEHDEIVRNAPAWIWMSDDEEQAGSVPDRDNGKALVSRLLRPTCRRLLLEVCRVVERLGQPLAAKLIPPLEPGQDPFDLIDQWQERLTRFLAQTPDGFNQLLSAGGNAETLEEERRLRAEIDAKLSPVAAAAVRTYLDIEVPPADRVDQFRLVAAIVRQLEDEDIEATEIGFATIRRRLARASQGTQPSSASVTIDHNMVDYPASKALTVLKKPDPNVEYGVVSVPLVLVSSRARELRVRIEWNVKHDARGWPREWPGPEPAAPFLVSPIDWHEQDRQVFHMPFVARLPMRSPLRAQGSPRLEVSARPFDAISGAALSDPVSLLWDNIGLSMPPLALKLKDEANPAYVDAHPIGPQAQANVILGRLQAGSLAVIAPRRFGKSTLVEYLVEHGQAHDLLIPRDIRCTKHAMTTGFNYESMWQEVSQLLQDAVGSGASGRLEDRLPTEDAFNHVRRAAKAKGYSAVVLLFDEAQLLFPRNDTTLGSRLKTLLERHWHRSDDASMVPFRMGFIGLPSLRSRAGNDFMALLRPIARDRMDEEELRPLVRSAGGGLQTTKTARYHLAHVSANLYILRVMLDRLVDRARRDSRVWVNYLDVVEVEHSLRRELKAGQAPELAGYIRDALNEGERVETWEPIASFPTAVAAASAIASGAVTSVEALAPKVMEQLNRWCRAQASPITVPHYDEAAVSGHLDVLKERKVIDGTQFSSRLLEDWLLGMAGQTTNETFRRALFNGAQRRIVVPEGAEHITVGGEAVVRRAEVNGVMLAYRSRKLRSSLDREVFLQSNETLAVIRKIVEDREPGSDYLFEFKDVGLAERDPSEAIQVYRWVEGEDLSSQQGGLSADMVVDIGVKMATALRAIHAKDVLHRDICPRNIVLNRNLGADSVRPVLIDFGFARVMSGDLKSLFTGEHIAPECRESPPRWGKPADVFALCWTLATVLAADEPGTSRLIKVLNDGRNADPAKRPNADELLVRLRAVETANRIADKRTRAWAEISGCIAPQESTFWFRANVDNSKSALIDVYLGSIKRSTQTFAEIALFLQRIVESHSHGHHGLLNLLDRGGLSERDRQAVRDLHALRNSKGHAVEAIRDDVRAALAQFDGLPPGSQVQVFLTGASVVARRCGISSLLLLVGKVLHGVEAA